MGFLLSFDSTQTKYPLFSSVCHEFIESHESLVSVLCNVSDEEVVASWAENLYWQYFCGEQYFRTVKQACSGSKVYSRTFFR
jgi:hypothetical protein